MEYSADLPANFMKRSMIILACLFLLKKNWDKCAYNAFFFFTYFRDFFLSEKELSYKTSYKYATCF